MKMLLLICVMFFLSKDATAQNTSTKSQTFAQGALVKSKNSSLEAKKDINIPKKEDYTLELSIPMMGNISIKEPSQDLYNDTRLVHQKTEASQLLLQFAKVKIDNNELDLVFSCSYRMVNLDRD